MNILGLSGSSHDPAAAVVSGGRSAALIEEERLVREKHAARRLPVCAAKAALQQAGIGPGEIDCVAYFLDPGLFNRQVWTHLLGAGFPRYVLQPWSYDTRQFLKRGNRYRHEVRNIMQTLGIKAPVEYVEHHLAHAGLAFWGSGFPEAMILSLDNMGELDSTLLARGRGTEIKVLRRQKIPHSLGMLYAVITDFLGFKPWNDEGKVMALAAYGRRLLPPEDLIQLIPGGFLIRRSFQMIQTPRRDRCFSHRLARIIGEPREPGGPLEQRHMDIAATVQQAVEYAAGHLAAWLHEQTGLRQLCVTGGVAQNCKLNGELLRLPFVDEIYVPPAPGDAGAALGAALCAFTGISGNRPEALSTAALGRIFDNAAIERALQAAGYVYRILSGGADEIARLLLEHKVIGYYQGRSEAGPRALGHRSLLALPQEQGTRDFLNAKVKGREIWRPFAPSILQSKAGDYFPGSDFSRFMNIAFRALPAAADRVPAVVHVDQTVRVQAVVPAEEPLFAAILEELGRRTGDPIVLNTSFNRRGEPIVDSPQDALACFRAMPIEALVMGDYVIRKK